MRYPATSKTLLEKLRSGDDIPWQEFFDRYSPLIRVSGQAAGLTAEECGELVQNVMVQFFHQSKHFVFDPGIARFRTYFSRVIRSQAALIRRNQKRHPVLSLDGETEAVLIAEAPFTAAFEQQWRDTVMQQALEHLKKKLLPRNYLAFYRTSYEGRSIRETAELLQLSCDQVYAARSRALAILRAFVRETMQEEVCHVSEG